MKTISRFAILIACRLPLSALALDCGTEIQRKKSTINWAELQDWQEVKIQELLQQAREAEVARDPLRCQKILSRIDGLLSDN